MARIDGVRELKSTIDVLPVSQFDEDLRYRVARAIYGNPSFWNYAAMSNPPIHIIVEHGRVTLTGVVNSEWTRRWRARSRPGSASSRSRTSCGPMLRSGVTDRDPRSRAG